MSIAAPGGGCSGKPPAGSAPALLPWPTTCDRLACFCPFAGASKPHHLVDANGVVLGYSHFGMLAAARWIKGQTRQLLEQALADNPGYSLKIIGHSLGGGTAALLTMMLREAGGWGAQGHAAWAGLVGRGSGGGGGGGGAGKGFGGSGCMPPCSKSRDLRPLGRTGGRLLVHASAAILLCGCTGQKCARTCPTRHAAPAPTHPHPLTCRPTHPAGSPFTGVTCIAVACPSCMTLELAQSCADYVVGGLLHYCT